MLAAFKEYILPFLVYGVFLGACMTALTRRAYVACVVFCVLVMLPQLWYPTQEFPIGTQTLTLLTLAALIGGLLQRTRETPRAPRTGLVLVMIAACTLSLLVVARKWPAASLALTADNVLMANWKNYVMMLALYFVGYYCVRTGTDVRRLVQLMLGMVIFLAWREFAGFLSGETFSALKRSVGPFWILGMNPNHFAAFIAHISVISLGLLAMDDDRRRRRFYLAVFLASLYPLFYAYSRGAYVAVFFALTVLGVIKFRPLLLVTLVLGLFWTSILPESVVERIQSTETEDGEIEQSAALRLELWQIAKNLFLENPVFGIGTGGFFFATEGMQLRNVHNYFYQMAAEQGIAGLLVLASMFLKAAASGWSLYKKDLSGFQRGLGLGFVAAVSAMLVTNLFGDRFSQLEVGAYFWIFFGLVDRVRSDRSVQEITGEAAAEQPANSDPAPALSPYIDYGAMHTPPTPAANPAALPAPAAQAALPAPGTASAQRS